MFIEILPWTPLQLLVTHNFFPCFFFAHIFFFMNNILSLIRINFFFHTLIFLFFSLANNTQNTTFLFVNFPWPLFDLILLVQWKFGNPFLQSMAFSSFKNQWELRMICLPIDFRMRIIMPNETLKIFHPPTNRMIILMINGIGGLILSLILNIVVRFLNLILILSVRLTLTSYFLILIISSN